MKNSLAIVISFSASGAEVFLSQIASTEVFAGLFLGFAVAFFGLGIAFSIRDLKEG